MRWRSPAWANRCPGRDRRDNNSSDATPDVVASFGPAVRYIKERRQGVSFARNTGIEAARALDAELVAFVDDDVEATPNWAVALGARFRRAAMRGGIGGRVLPSNADELPPWVTPEHWGPLARPRAVGLRCDLSARPDRRELRLQAQDL